MGAIVGAYFMPHQLRSAEQVLLQVLAQQTSAALENSVLAEEKRRLDRLASLGEMAAGVAHEVRNPLASIKTTMQLLRDDLEIGSVQDEPESAQEAVEVVLQEVERLDHIVRDLLSFARPRQSHLVACDLPALCEHLVHLLHPQCAKHSIQITFTSAYLPVVQVDAGQIEQVLMNLLLNAIQAMPSGGALTITCQLHQNPILLHGIIPISSMQNRRLEYGDASPERSAITLTANSYQQTWAEIAISDTGTGIAPEKLERIFQPFFTTKAHGIGLGLPITKRLIEDHRGQLLVTSTPGAGTTFTIRLPLSIER
jgi:signal transduction histidine kinase